MFLIPRLDHVVVDTRDRIDEAQRVYCSLGFYLTDRSRHTLGSINHLAVFNTDYLELLGIDRTAGAVRPDLLGFPVGLNGLVFSADQPDALFNDLRAREVPAEEPVAFSRPVRLPGKTEEARFRVVRLRPGTVSYGRVYFCHHLTPDLVWRPEWRQHPNGAIAIARVAVAARDPAAASGILGRIFGVNALHLRPDGAVTLTAGGAEIDLIKPDELAKQLGDAMPDPAGRADYMAALSIRTASLAQAARALKAGGIRGVRIETQRILVPAAEAMNVALEFVE